MPRPIAHSFRLTIQRKRRTSARWLRRTIHGVLAASLAIVGLLIFATPAFAHENFITGVPICASPLGSGYTITWTVANDFNLAEAAYVSSVTGGITTVSPTQFSIGPSGNGSGGYGSLPYTTATLTQTLPASASGTITLNVNAKFTDDYLISNSASVTLPTDCSAPPPAPPPVTPPATPPVSPASTVSAVPPSKLVITPVVTPAAVSTAKLGLSIAKTERIGTSGAFVRGPVQAVVGEELEYRIVVTNTGNTALVVALADAHCDAKTLSPAHDQTVAAGGSVIYRCSHLLATLPSANQFRNVASAVGTSAQGSRIGPVKSSVLARVSLPKLTAKELAKAKPAVAVLKKASFTG